MLEILFLITFIIVIIKTSIDILWDKNKLDIRNLSAVLGCGALFVLPMLLLLFPYLRINYVWFFYPFPWFLLVLVGSLVILLYVKQILRGRNNTIDLGIINRLLYIGYGEFVVLVLFYLNWLRSDEFIFP